MALACWNSFSIPFFVAFSVPVEDDLYMFTINSSIDFLFFVDIVFNFRTSYFNQRTGDEVVDSRIIAKSYLYSSRFLIDLLASIPIDTFASLILGKQSSQLQLFGLL